MRTRFIVPPAVARWRGVILRRAIRPRLIGIFVGVVVGIVAVGFGFNALGL